MGLALGYGLGLRNQLAFGGGLPVAITNKFLFIGNYSSIADGKMPNTIGSDWLTVSGAVGSETYQCPNTAPYIAADTDYFWFNTNATQRTVLTSELIGYDIQRSPVKYDDNSPYALRSIAIIKAGEIFTQSEWDAIFKYFWLSIEWQNNTNGSGRLKGNRFGQNLFIGT